jgi:hypothetical protein
MNWGDWVSLKLPVAQQVFHAEKRLLGRTVHDVTTASPALAGNKLKVVGRRRKGREFV